MSRLDRALQTYESNSMATTSPQRLVTLLYDRLLRDLNDAETAIVNGAIETAHRCLVHAQDIVLEFQLALDTDGFDGGGALAEVYAYLTERLVAANQYKNPAIVVECRTLVAPIAEAFAEIANQPMPAAAAGSV